MAALAALKARRLAQQSEQQQLGLSPAAQGSSQPAADHDQGEEQQQQEAAPGKKLVRAWAWQCQVCTAECVPVRSESRCLCGHRLKDHAKLQQDGPVSRASRCSAARCGCPEFFFIVAEGSWALRCRCKHKHTEHDAAHARRRCAKAGCTCDGFHSPWVCNCDHPWDQHELLVVEREVKTMEQMMAEASLAVNNHGAIQRGLEDGGASGS